MAKQLQLLPIFATFFFFFCFAAFAGVAFASPKFVVEGRVYCDTCRAGFVTELTSYMKGAKVKLECKHFSTGEVETKVDGVTDESGTYKLEVTRNHEEDICEVTLVESPNKSCSERIDGRDRARVILSDEAGMTSHSRYANPLGFLTEIPMPDCGQELQKYALGADDDWSS